MSVASRILSSGKYLFPEELLKDRLSFILLPILLKGKITTIFAPAGVGKSTFTYKVIESLLESQAIRKVLCIFSDADTTNSEFQALVDKYFDRKDLSGSRFIPLFPDRGFWRDFGKDIESGSLKEQGIDLVIVDSLEQFFELVGLDFHRNIGMFLGAMRRLGIQGISSFLIHHTNKTGTEIAGRAVIVNQSDIVYGLRRAGRNKWFGEAVKHRGAKELDGKVDFYAELTDNGIEFSNTMLDDKYGYVVHLIKLALAKGGRLRQYEVINEVQKLAKSENENAQVGRNKIREALAKYDGIFWRAENVGRNTLEYELIVKVEVKEKEEKESEKSKLISEIEKMIMKGKLYANKLPPLTYNGKKYTILTDLEREVPVEVLREYVQRLKKGEIGEDFNFDF